MGFSNHYAPMAVLIISTETEIKSKNILDSIELFNIGLNKRRSDIYNFSSSILTSYLVKLQKNRNFRPYRTHSSVNNLEENINNLPLLPSSLNRNYTLKYRNTICEILNEVKEKTNISSLTIRIKDYYSNNEDNFLWLLANSIKSDPTHVIKFDPNKNIHSFLLNSPKYSSILIPNVHDKKLANDIYEGCNYFAKRSETVSELCIKVINEEHRILASLNVENSDFESLWLYEDALINIGKSIGRELIDDELYSFYGEKSLRKIFNIYLSHSRHNLINSISTINNEIKSNKPGVYKKIGHELESVQDFIENEYMDLDNENYELLDLSEILKDKVEQISQNVKHNYVKIVRIQNQKKITISAPKIFTHLLYKLLFEQVSTLDKIGESNNDRIKLCCGIREENENIFIDFINTAKENKITQDISRSLFWHKIDIEERKGSGRTGLGLVLLGNMLRSIDIIPNAYPSLNQQLTSIYGSDYTGIWIELKFKK